MITEKDIKIEITEIGDAADRLDIVGKIYLGERIEGFDLHFSTSDIENFSLQKIIEQSIEKLKALVKIEKERKNLKSVIGKKFSINELRSLINGSHI